MKEILDARENRSKHISELMDAHQYKSIVIMKANVPGTNKNLMKMRFICNYYHTLVFDEFELKIIDTGRIESVDGNYIYYVIDEEGLIVKEKTILLEDDNLLGRLIDIDVYYTKAISRTDVSCEMRQCLICDNYAHICVRNQTHSEQELFNVIDSMVHQYLEGYILNTTIKAIFAELDLYPKFGLVSSHDSGAHTDMDYETFVKSTLSIKSYLKEFIDYGLKDLDSPELLKEIGLRAETAMFEATNGVNTHKGLIFALGLFLPVVSKGILYNKDTSYIKDEIQRISKIIIGNYYEEIREPYSHGDQIYVKHGLMGIRGEALNGFGIVFDAPSYRNIAIENREYDYLIYLMSKLDDTTIIHRSGLDMLNCVKEDMKTILLNGGYAKNQEEVLKLSNEYKTKNISPGGSADLFVLKLLLEEFKYLLCGASKNGICI